MCHTSVALAHPHIHTALHRYIETMLAAQSADANVNELNAFHTHLPAPSSVFREVSTGEAVCPHASHWARAAGSNSFSSSFEFRIFRTNKMSSPTAVQPPPPVKPPPTPPSVGASAGKGVSSKIYNGIIGYADKFVPAKLRPLWVHPAGVILST